METGLKLETFRNEKVQYIETSLVKEGVTCDVYLFVNDNSKDLGVVHVQSYTKTPLQEVVSGDKAVEGLLQGAGTLKIISCDGRESVYNLSELKNQDVVVHVGEKMQWEANDEELVFFEICYPPYQEGRFKNL